MLSMADHQTSPAVCKNHCRGNGHNKSNGVCVLRPSEQTDDESELDVLSSFGFPSRHYLRKAVSTTFKAVSETIRSKAHYFADALRDETAESENMSESHGVERQHRAFHQVSNSLSRSGTRFVSSLKNRHSRKSKAWSYNPPGARPIDVDIPNPIFSSLHLEYPWLSYETESSTNSGTLDAPTMVESLEEWLQRRENRKARYEAVSSMSPLRSSLDDSVHATTLVGSEDGLPKDSPETSEKANQTKDGFIVSSDSANPQSLDSEDMSSTTKKAAGNKTAVTVATQSRFPPLLPTYTIVEETQYIGLPSIDATLEKSNAEMSRPQSPCRVSRPAFSRQISIMSAESSESCALTSKSFFEGAVNHHRRASESRDQATKDSVREALSNISKDEKSFVVDATSEEQGFMPSPGRLPQNGHQISGEEPLPLHQSAPATPCRETSSGESSPLDRRSRVSFIIPDDHSPTGKVSKQFRRPTPPPFRRSSPTRIPAPTYDSPTASSRKSVPLIAPRSEASDGSSSAVCDELNLETSSEPVFNAARLPLFGVASPLSRKESSETDFYTVTECSDSLQQEDQPFSPDDTLCSGFLNLGVEGTSSAPPEMPRYNDNPSIALHLTSILQHVESGNNGDFSPADTASHHSFSTNTSGTTISPVEASDQARCCAKLDEEPCTRNMPGHFHRSWEETSENVEGLAKSRKTTGEILFGDKEDDDPREDGRRLERRASALRRRKSLLFHSPSHHSAKWNPIRSSRNMEF